MNLNLLQSFVNVAELEHIGRAAERLHISQSPLSRQIRQLEKELGLQLFARERQRIRLTEAGKWLLGRADSLLAHAARVREEAGERALGKTGTLAVGFVNAAIWNGVLPKFLRRFQTEFPKATLDLRNMRSTIQMEAVESGSLDIGFVSVSGSSSAIETKCVSEEPYVLAVPSVHPLARKRKVEPRDLDQARWILLSHSRSQERRVKFLASCAKIGFVPQVVQEVTEPNTLLGLVESGFGVGVIEQSARLCAPRSIKFQALPWLPLKSRIYMIRPASGRQALADSFAGYAPQLNVARQQQ